MNITPTLVEEFSQWLDTYWTTYLSGDIDTWAAFIKEDYYNIGGTKEEIWHSRQEILDYTLAMADQMQGKAELRNRKVEASAYGEFVMVNEFTDMYVEVDGDWSFYGHFRMSSLLEQTETGWIVQHQHGSFPDMKAMEGEAFGKDALRAENQRLQQSVQERTAELLEKNKELKIEAALERVRTVAMAMKSPDDMLKVCRVISDELSGFGIKSIRNVQTAIIDEQAGVYLCYQYFTAYDQETVEKTAYLKSPVEHGMVQQMLASENAHFTNRISGKELKEFINHRKSETHFPDPLLEEAKELSYCFLSIGQGGLGLTLYESLEEATLILFKRFHQVFSLAYSRFRDIEKAEVQAREAHIEAALERVRAQTMAMHSSEDVGKCIVKMFSELTALGVDEGTRFGIGILNHDNENNQLWTASKVGEEIKMHIGNLDMSLHPLLKNARRAWIAQTPLHVYVLEGEDLLNYYQMLNSAPDYKIKIPIDNLPLREIQHCFIFEQGFFYAFSPREFQPELISITQRFTSVFGQTYRRYLDLVKAEEQGREAEIELALERVRARSLSMHRSEELQNVIEVVFEQLVALKIPVEHAGFIIDYQEREDMHIWLADQQQGVPSEITIPYFDSPHWNSFREAKAKGESFFANLLPFEVKNKFYQDLFQFIPTLTKEAQETIFSKPALAISTVLLDDVGLYIEKYAGTPFSAEENAVLLRVGKVFQQAYTRFLDLQKAEAQAREADIELALERVRARTMAMQHSDELADTSFLLDSQVRALGIKTRGCAFNIYGKTDSTEWFSSEMGTMPTYKTPRENVFLRYFEAGQRGESMYIQEFADEACAVHYEYLCTLPVMGDALIKMKENGGAFPRRQIDHATFFKYGYLLFITLEPVPDAHDIFKRFAKVFEQTFTRFLDLQKAESQAREAQIEAALEKVRSRTLAMQTSDELAETAAVLFAQLIHLGVKHERINIGIVSEDQQTIEFWSTEQRGTIIKTSFTGSTAEANVLGKLYNAWKGGQESLSIVLTDEKLNDWILYCENEIGIPFDHSLLGEKRVQTAAFFSKGMLMLTTPEEPPQQSTELLIRFASVFNLTFTRFSDLKIAEANALRAAEDLEKLKVAKASAEKALTDLKAAQVQLVQQEKLASLGQLTAGIAHEIKNPLNFVNNFSEVSIEMIEEALEERAKSLESRDETLVDEILEDIRSNLKKVHEHGSRANGIVTSMLQHSRASGSKREPKALNPIVKEFVNLAYHGMRAAKSPINVDIEVQLDPKVGDVSLISEDFSRVILNLCNNAFDAMREKTLQGFGTLGGLETYLPKLKVKTALEGGKVLLSVADNGTGIPKEIRDKILQPFFTTKKGTEGTGLGLSITHDIVKAHGGELKVVSKGGKGTEFIVLIAV
ncbi:hypothetical protein GCM10009119_05160 [Algoriphagus jejuensis]|uniref:histidine kinase n=1 Tax=Algoriphagus jejuensis TaxID=419934 RepID=A0ABN1MW56_9BACT